MLPMFPDPIFEIVFILSFVLVAVFIAATIYRMFRFGKSLGLSGSDGSSSAKEKEIIREVVKIRCSYCRNLYEETQDRCPNCGAKH